MMGVLKVIVDELPEYCAECPYREVVTAQIGEKCRFGWHKIDDSLNRPDWCPLLSSEEFCIVECKTAEQLKSLGHKERIDGFVPPTESDEL